MLRGRGLDAAQVEQDDGVFADEHLLNEHAVSEPNQIKGAVL
jgi:hypothetical protein